MRGRRWATVVGLVLLIGPLAGPAQATTIRVTSNLDSITTGGPPRCTLRAAVLAANRDEPVAFCPAGSGDGDVIELVAGTYDLTRSGAGEDDGLTGDLDVTRPVTIRGAGRDATIIDGQDADRVFDKLPTNSGFDDTLVLEDLTVRNGRAGFGGCVLAGNDALNSVLLVEVAVRSCDADVGGGLYVVGTTQVFDSVLEDNSAGGGFDGRIQSYYGGGAIAAFGDLRVQNSTFARNSSTNGGGGAVDVQGGQGVIEGSTFTENSAVVGGAIYRTGDRGDRVIIFNTTVTGNTATQEGGGLLLEKVGGRETPRALDLRFSTVADNHAPRAGGVSSINSRVADSIVAGNTADSVPDYLDPGDGPPDFEDAGGNVIGVGGDAAWTAASKVGTAGAPLDPRLAALADFGGPTQTRNLSERSPAVDAAVASRCPGFDQRGVARPQGPACDAGAVERDTARPTVVVERTGPSTTNARSVSFTLTFSEPMRAFTAEDVCCAASPGLTATPTLTKLSATSFQLDVALTGDGTFTVSAGSALKDIAGNEMLPVGQTVTVDQTAPTVVLELPAASDPSPSAIPVPAQFSEPVSGLTPADFETENATVDTLRIVDADTATLVLRPIATGTVKLTVVAEAVQDAATNTNPRSATSTRTFTNVVPTATVALSPRTPGTSDTLTATATKQDGNGDAVQLRFLWKVGDTVRRDATTTGLTDTFDLAGEGNGGPGDRVSVTVTPDDGRAGGQGQEVSDAVTIVVDRMTSNATKDGVKYASIVDCTTAVANPRNRPFYVEWTSSGTKRFRATSYSSLLCDDDPGTPGVRPAGFDRQVGVALGTLNGVSGYRLEFTLVDGGSAAGADKVDLRVSLVSGDVTQKTLTGSPASGAAHQALTP